MATTPRTARKKSKPAQEPKAVPGPLLKAFQALSDRVGAEVKKRGEARPLLITGSVRNFV
jgi:hypothetical protein